MLTVTSGSNKSLSRASRQKTSRESRQQNSLESRQQSSIEFRRPSIIDEQKHADALSLAYSLLPELEFTCFKITTTDGTVFIMNNGAMVSCF